MIYNDESKVLFFKLNPDAVIPSKRVIDAGYDVYSCFADDYMVVYPNTCEKIKTGIASVMSDRYCMILKERSSVGSKNTSLVASVIDSGYRGEWLVAISNHNDIPFVITKAYVSDEKIKTELGIKEFIRYPYEKAITQGLLVEVPKVEIKEISKDEFELYTTERGVGGFGSSKK